MTQPVPTIAVLSSSQALASILGATLRRGHQWRVREFRDSRSLNAYMRIAPLAVLVSDYHLGQTNAADVARALREDELIVSRQVQIIALSRTIDKSMHEQCVRAGIDEVLAKPMSPLYLQERIRARLRSGPQDYLTTDARYAGPERRGRAGLADTRSVPVERRGENVVSFLAHKEMRDQGEPISPA